MNYHKIIVYTTSEGIEPVCGRLYSLGVTGVEIEDEKDFNEFLKSNQPYWDYVDEELCKKMSGETRVMAYLADDPTQEETFHEIAEALKELKEIDSESRFGRLEMDVQSVSEDDWANNWKQYYKPTRIGKKLVVVPEWESYDARENDRIIKIKPGMAFGTGTHETTRLCMELIEKYVSEGTSMLDIGTGSGILAVAALILGAQSALGVDIDEIAVKVAMENACLNGVGERLSTVCGDLVGKVTGRYDLITANIVADVIIRLAPSVKQYLAKGGVFIASGIIDTREDEVTDALFAEGLTAFDRRTDRGWVALALRAN
ncbi:MAG TPA: 50S ribosomal protein L11 methyltransferase [Clostridia bacterium]|nr:50S ribosomal protein L11 methyltransferase [Clostridia bacterium]